MNSALRIRKIGLFFSAEPLAGGTQRAGNCMDPANVVKQERKKASARTDDDYAIPIPTPTSRCEPFCGFALARNSSRRSDTSASNAGANLDQDTAGR
jgi:hypothetical protein